MKSVPVSRLSNDALLCELKENVAQGWSRTARQVVLIAEVERRRLYAPAGYPSMFAFCVGELHLSEDAAYKRIWVARAARRYPNVLAALADGHVHLSGLTMLTRHLTPETADELLQAATRKSRREIAQLLAERFPKVDMPARVTPVRDGEITSQVAVSSAEVAPESLTRSEVVANAESQLAPGQVRDPVIFCQTRAETVLSAPVELARVAPLAPQRYGVQFTFDQAGHDLLRHVQNLLGNRVPSGDLAEVFQLALKAYAAQLEKQKFAATERPSKKRRRINPDSRHIASHVMRAVWKRDKGRCTYVSDGGKRCESRWDLEFDHEQEYARGGDATVSNIRLRCRAHNQHAAEQTYGAGFMQAKRERSAEARRREASVH